MYPSLNILDNRTSIENLLFMSPVPTRTELFQELKLPTALSMVPYAFFEMSSVLILILAPKEAAPFVEEPTPL